jgi:hypothetical protein
LVVNNPYGSVTSGVSVLSVVEPPAIVSQPQSVTVVSGQNAVLRVEATGTVPLGYQWYFGGTELAGAQANELVLKNITPGQAGAYSVVVSNAYGSRTSEVAVVSVVVPPTILSGLQDQTITNGGTLLLSIEATSTDPLVYRWYFDGMEMEAGNSQTLTIPNAAPRHSGVYSVSVENALGSAISSARVQVVIPARIVMGPVDQVATNGGTVQFAVVAEGTEPLSYRWYFNDTNVVAADLLTRPGGMDVSLTVAEVSAGKVGQYSVVVSNDYGMASAHANLYIAGPPQIVSSPQSLVTPTGSNAILAVAATGYPAPAYQWFYEATNLLAGETNSILRITSARPDQSGRYTVSVSNSLGQVTSAPATVLIGDPPAITTQPENISLVNGQTAIFEVKANGAQPLSYQWYFQGTNPIPSAVSSIYRLKNATPAHNGSYLVAVSNTFGRVLSRAVTLRVLSEPHLLSITRTGHVAYVTISTHSNLSYTVSAGNSPGTSEWTVLPQGYQRLGTGGPMVLEDPYATNSSRFYRLVAE